MKTGSLPAKADPEAAFRNRVDPAWTNRHPWVRTVAEEWVQRDPVAVAKAIDSLPQNPTQGRIEGARVVLDGWFERDETAAVEHMVMRTERATLARAM